VLFDRTFEKEKAVPRL